MKIRFIPVKHGDEVDFGNLGLFGVSGAHKYLGFKPGRPSKREGWLVVAVRNNALAPCRRHKHK